MENLIVVIIAVLAAYYLWRKFFSAKNKGGCGCGCSGCGGDECSDEREKMSTVYGMKESDTTSPQQEESPEEGR